MAEEGEDEEVPDFQAVQNYQYDLLPPGIYPTDKETFRERFVAEFPASTSREDLFENFERWREDLGPDVSATQWVDGSYVEAKEEPNDIDVLSWTDPEDLNNLSPQEQAEVERHLGGEERIEGKYGIHAFTYPYYPEGHPQRGTFEKIWKKWKKRTFGKTYNKDDNDGGSRVEKGFLELEYPENDDPPDVPREGGDL